MFRLLSLLVVIVSAFGMAPSARASVTLDPIDNAVVASVGTDIFGAVLANEPGPFSHQFDFNIPAGPDNFVISSVTSSLLSNIDIDFTSIFLDTHPFIQTGFDPGAEQWELPNPVLLAAGAHAITLNGSVVGSSRDGSYSGVINVAPIPEPATWLMMLLAFGAIGLVLRRRRRLGPQMLPHLA